MGKSDFSDKAMSKPIATAKHAKLVGIGDDDSALAEALERTLAGRSPRREALLSVGKRDEGSLEQEDVVASAPEPTATAEVIDALQEPWEKLRPDGTVGSINAAPTPDQVRADLNAALRPIRDFVDGAVAAIVVAAARNHEVDAGRPGALEELFGARELARVREEVVRAIQSHGAAEFHSYAYRVEDAWRAKAGPLRLDLEGAITLMEISAMARYDASDLSLHAFFDCVTARLSGAGKVGVEGLGSAWAGGSLSGPGTTGGAFLGFDGAGAQIGVTYGRAEVAAGLDLLGRKSQIGVGVSAGFELGLQLSTTVSLKLGPLGASVPNVPIAAATWAAGAFADMARDPERTVEGAVVDLAGAVADVAELVIDVGSSVVTVIEGFLGYQGSDDDVVTRSETAADGRIVEHDESFEGHNSTWILVGNAGIDVAKGNAARGQNNAWLRATWGVHVLASFFEVRAHAPYVLSMRIRTSSKPVDLVVGVCEAPRLDAKGRSIIEECHEVVTPRYTNRALEFTTTSAERVLIYVGLLGKGSDAWCQIDEVSLHTPNHVID